MSFRPVDMTRLPADLVDFDLLWSSCALEHLGQPNRGPAFVLDSLRCLRPGGVAVHTTELRVKGNDDVDLGGVVLYARHTMERLVARLRLAATTCGPTSGWCGTVSPTASSTKRLTRTSRTT